MKNVAAGRTKFLAESCPFCMQRWMDARQRQPQRFAVHEYTVYSISGSDIGSSISIFALTHTRTHTRTYTYMGTQGSAHIFFHPKRFSASRIYVCESNSERTRNCSIFENMRITRNIRIRKSEGRNIPACFII